MCNSSGLHKVKDVSHNAPAACVATLSIQLPFTISPPSVASTPHWTQWLQCSHVCASAALNPVTGRGMSSTEIAAEPLAHPQPSRCALPPQERPTSSRAHTHGVDVHTGCLCVLRDRGGDGGERRV